MMKKFFKSIAVTLALVLAVNVPVSAANTANRGFGAFAAMGLVQSMSTTNDGTGDGGTGDKDDKPGDDGTGDKDDESGVTDPTKQVVAIAIKDTVVAKDGSKSLTVFKGDTFDLTANVIVNEDHDYTVGWSVEGDAVELTGSAGAKGETAVLKAVKGGTATIMASAGGKTDGVTVKVVEYMTGLRFTQSEYTGYLKHKVDFSKFLVKTPASATDAITYSVDNKKVATVDKNTGIVTMKKVGETTITAATEQGILAQAKIKVEAGVPAKKLSITDINGTVIKKAELKDIGATQELKVAVEVDQRKYAGQKDTETFTWTTNKPQFVEVHASEDGRSALITATGVGSAKITVQAATGKKASITVKANAILKTITIVDEKGNQSASVAPLKKLTLTAQTDPVQSKDKIYWSTSDKKVATVSGKGVVTIKTKATEEPIKVTITAANHKKAELATVKDTFEITVNPSQITGISGISGKSTLLVGETADYTAALQGQGSPEEITWISSSPKVLTIDHTGKATAVKAGKATIKATVTIVETKKNGSKVGKTKTVSYKVTVTQPTTTLSMKKAEVAVMEGKARNVSFSAVASPKGAKTTVTYSISEVKTVSGSSLKAGDVAIKKSRVTVPATAKAGDVITVRATAANGVFCEGKIYVVSSKKKVEFGVGKQLTIKQGEKVNLQTKVTPDDKGETITYTSNKPFFVSVDRSGNVYGLHPGKATITAKTTSGAKKSISVTVTQSYVTSTPTNDGNDGTTDGNKN